MRQLLYTDGEPLTGSDVEAWQDFLIRQLNLTWESNGVFGPKTHRATVQFQTAQHLAANGRVADDTIARARGLGFVEPSEGATRPLPAHLAPHAPSSGVVAPVGADPSLAQPGFPAPTQGFTEETFGGRYNYRDLPGQDEIVITDGWESRNITPVPVPQLKGVSFYSHNNPSRSKGNASFNRRGADQLRSLWQAWDDAGLVGRIKTYGGAYNARYRRGSARRKYLDLSNHAYGTAFDINVEWNPLGKNPAAMGALGCVRELVQIANAHGFYWGGHYANRKDGMHFELARLL